MKHYNSTFFCDNGFPPKVTIHTLKDNPAWPLNISIDGASPSVLDGGVCIHLKSEIQLIALKNSIVWEYERYRRKVL
uniref:Uncharacterized protein n=1 Tax=viral metagenome TaxID=1070528 RepID=A0A6H2A545_9ZZZZ